MTIMFHPILLLLGFWYILPAYIANGFAVFGKFVKFRHPIDGDRLCRDNQPVFGPGKTWEGFLIGFSSGSLVGVLQVITAPYLVGVIVQYLDLPLDLVPIVLLTPLLVVLVALGALFGDLIGSFLKRRMKIGRGQPAPILDQLDFITMALLLGALSTPIPLIFAIFLLITTPLIHLLANIIGYFLRLKQEPW